MNDVTKIAKFMQLGGQTAPFDVDEMMTTAELLQFFGRIEDELFETQDAIGYFDEYWGINVPHDELPPRDYAETVDGFLDTAYTALSAAIRLAGVTKATQAWEAVCDANLAKVDGRHGPVVRNPDTGKIEKPEGWQAPDIEKILQEALL